MSLTFYYYCNYNQLIKNNLIIQLIIDNFFLNIDL
jgi:hypothetical protein